MKTKDLIKKLQEEDPSGESHVYIPGIGIPYGAHSDPGYWDGSFSYIDDDGNYVTTTEGSKVIIDCMDIALYVESRFNLNVKWEDIKEKFRFKLGYLNDEHNQQVINGILNTAKEEFDQIKEINERLYNNSLKEMIENAEKGWKWFQNKEVENDKKRYTYYGWIVIDENKKEDSSNVHMTQPVLFSGLWEKVDNNRREGYYEWIYKK